MLHGLIIHQIIQNDYMRKLTKICSPKRERSLKVMLPKVCNYRCSYCFQKKKDGPYNPCFFTPQKLTAIGSMIEKFNIERIELIGGEPTVFDIFPLIDYIRDYPIKEFFIITNFSQPNGYFLKLHQSLEKMGTVLKLCCSLHDEFVDYREFVDKINNLFDQGISHIAVEFVVARINLENCVQIIEYLKKNLHEGLFVFIDCDMFDEEVKAFYKNHRLSQDINANGMDVSVSYEDGEQTFFPRQELRLRSFSEEKYCITDFVLSESGMINSCYRELGAPEDLIALSDQFKDEEKFKCGLSICRFCDNPQIFFVKDDMKRYMKDYFKF